MIAIFLILISLYILFLLQRYISIRRGGDRKWKQQPHPSLRFNYSSSREKSWWWTTFWNKLLDKDSHIRKDDMREDGLLSYWILSVYHYIYTGVVYFKIHIYDPLFTILHSIQDYTRFFIPFTYNTHFQQRIFRRHAYHNNTHSDSFSSLNTEDPLLESSPFLKPRDRKELPELKYIGGGDESTLASYYPRFAFRHDLQKLERPSWDPKSIEPAFVTEEEYPSNWLTYDPIQGCVVPRKKLNVVEEGEKKKNDESMTLGARY